MKQKKSKAREEWQEKNGKIRNDREETIEKKQERRNDREEKREKKRETIVNNQAKVIQREKYAIPDCKQGD